MSLPDIGLSHSDGLEKAKRFANQNWGDNKQQQANLINSVVNQVKLAEGEQSANQVKEEAIRTMKNHDWNDNPKSRPGGFIVNISFCKKCGDRVYTGDYCEKCSNKEGK